MDDQTKILLSYNERKRMSRTSNVALADRHFPQSSWEATSGLPDEKDARCGIQSAFCLLNSLENGKTAVATQPSTLAEVSSRSREDEAFDVQLLEKKRGQESFSMTASERDFESTDKAFREFLTGPSFEGRESSACASGECETSGIGDASTAMSSVASWPRQKVTNDRTRTRRSLLSYCTSSNNEPRKAKSWVETQERTCLLEQRNDEADRTYQSDIKQKITESPKVEERTSWKSSSAAYLSKQLSMFEDDLDRREPATPFGVLPQSRLRVMNIQCSSVCSEDNANLMYCIDDCDTALIEGTGNKSLVLLDSQKDPQEMFAHLLMPSQGTTQKVVRIQPNAHDTPEKSEIFKTAPTSRRQASDPVVDARERLSRLRSRLRTTLAHENIILEEEEEDDDQEEEHEHFGEEEDSQPVDTLFNCYSDEEMNVENMDWILELEDPVPCVYSGPVVGGLPHGTGTLRFASGDVYAGPFYEGRMHGRLATYSSGADKTVYIGGYMDNVRHGHGELKSDGGRRYVGTFANGCADGYGESFHPDGRVHHKGQWKRGWPAHKFVPFIHEPNSDDDPSVASSQIPLARDSIMPSDPRRTGCQFRSPRRKLPGQRSISSTSFSEMSDSDCSYATEMGPSCYVGTNVEMEDHPDNKLFPPQGPSELQLAIKRLRGRMKQIEVDRKS